VAPLKRRPAIVLLGPMAAGKSTAARDLAELTGEPAVDTDALVEERLGAPIAEVFARDGEAAFRAAEEQVACQVLDGADGGVVALGGGALGDAAGFAAATYVRGVPVVQVPTTLLAMVDASIGGKTAIDIDAGKNLVGAFHEPAAVFADIGALGSLPRRQRSSGLAEIVKAAFLTDAAAVTQIERAIPAVLAGETGPTLACVTLAAEVKATVVTADPREQGLRVLLNFGHTMGHAIEAGGGYRLTHGEAVSLGLVYASAVAERLDLVDERFRATLERMLRAAKLPIRGRIPPRAWRLLARDKKARAGSVRWVLPRRVGKFALVSDVPDSALRAAARVLERR